jgi:NitT/TauT family transport system substrate-binding protein
MTVRLFENMRAVFYAPFYAAHALDAYGRYGLEVEMVTSPSPAHTALALLDGSADVSWGGPMRVLLTYDQEPDCDLVLFAEAVGRDPFFLIGREANASFGFADLLDAKVATVSEVATPWLCLQEDLRRAGHDPAQVDRVDGQTMAENARALQVGDVDVVQLYQPFVEQLLQDGGHVWYAAASRGLTAYTSFYTTRLHFETEPAVMAAMARGLYHALGWLNGAKPMTAAEAITDYFPAVELDLLAACIARYQDLGVWNNTPVLARPGFERLKASCLSGGLFNRDTPYETCVDNRYASQAAG